MILNKEGVQVEVTVTKLEGKQNYKVQQEEIWGLSF